MNGRYVLVRVLENSDEEAAATQWRLAEAIRLLQGVGSRSLTSFTMDEDESPVVLAKQLIRHQQ